MSILRSESPVFEWSEDKRKSVIERHGIDFADAVRVFDGPILKVPSPRSGEARWLAIGIVDGTEVTVVYTVRNGCHRIITARRARRNERRHYDAYVAGGGNPP